MSESQEDLDKFDQIEDHSKLNHQKNLDLFSEVDLNSTRAQEEFSKRCKMVNEYNVLIDMMKNQDLFEYSSSAHKEIPSTFIRCIDFFQNGKPSSFFNKR